MDLDKVLILAGELGELRRACSEKEAELRTALNGKASVASVRRKVQRIRGIENQQTRVKGLMQDGKVRSYKDIRRELSIPLSSARAVCSTLKSQGILNRVGYGLYQVVPVQS